jgi:hypothetical protein
VFWGFNSDWDALPDVHNVVEGIGEQFRELHAAAQASAASNEKSTTSPARS